METNPKAPHSVLIRGFEMESFEAFVWDYYLTLGDVSVDIDTEAIYRLIFGCREKYQAFLMYCKDNNYSFLGKKEKGHLTTSIFLLAFEQTYMYITDGVKDDISDIMDFSDGRIDLIFANEKIPNTNQSFISALMGSVYKKLTVNSKGEIIYLMGTVYGGYQVYSFESGIHYVDETGTMIDLVENNTKERCEQLREIEENLRDVVLSSQTDFTDEQALRLKELRDEFTSETRIKFVGMKEEELFFKSWVLKQYKESLSEFKSIQARDIRIPTLELVE